MRPHRLDSISRPGHRVAVLALGALLLTTGAGSAFAQATPADSVLRDFERTGDFVLEYAGQEKPKAKIYQSQRAAAILIKYLSIFESPVLVSPRSGLVQSVSIMSLSPRDNDVIDILADARLQPIAQFKLDGEDVVFDYQGQQVRLKPKPPLVGYKSSTEMKEYSPDYVAKAAAYEPDASTLDTLRGVGGDVEVRVFFGSWCPFCKRYVPRVLRVKEALEGSKVGFRFYGLPEPPFNTDPQAKAFDIKGVPTGVVLVGGKEVGRLGRSDWENPEQAILKLVRGG